MEEQAAWQREYPLSEYTWLDAAPHPYSDKESEPNRALPVSFSKICAFKIWERTYLGKLPHHVRATVLAMAKLRRHWAKVNSLYYCVCPPAKIALAASLKLRYPCYVASNKTVNLGLHMTLAESAKEEKKAVAWWDSYYEMEERARENRDLYYQVSNYRDMTVVSPEPHLPYITYRYSNGDPQGFTL